MEEMLQNTFKCLECGDDFLFEKSLQHHYDRKSIMIEVKAKPNKESKIQIQANFRKKN